MKNRCLKRNQLQAMYKNKMNSYCVKCKKDTENIDSKMFRTKNNI